MIDFLAGEKWPTLQDLAEVGHRQNSADQNIWGNFLHEFSFSGHPRSLVTRHIHEDR